MVLDQLDGETVLIIYKANLKLSKKIKVLQNN